MPMIPKDPDSTLVKRQFAVVYTKKRGRKRFPENCVEIVTSEEEALDMSDSDSAKYPAIVVGPSRSSEGIRLFYLLEWLD
ncbi:MAG: hypothetical protein ABW148_02560 [Sedimenticola sp.]